MISLRTASLVTGLIALVGIVASAGAVLTKDYPARLVHMT
jgi:hypothetical protein